MPAPPRGAKRGQREKLLDGGQIPPVYSQPDLDDGFALDLMAKDMKLALKAATEMDHPMFSGLTVAQLCKAAASQGYDPKGHTSIYAFLENLSGDVERTE